MTGLKNRVVAFLLRVANRLSGADQGLLGVDVTRSAVRIVDLGKSDESWHPRVIDEEPVRGEGGNIDSSAIRAAFASMQARNDVQTKNAAVSITLDNTIVQILTTPLLSNQEIESAIEFDSLWQNLVALPKDISEYSIEYQVLRRRPATNDMDILFIATEVSYIRELTNSLSECGMDTVLMDIRPFAARSALLAIDPKLQNEQFAIVELGGDENFVLVAGFDRVSITELFVSEDDLAGLEARIEDSAYMDRFFARLALQITQSLVGGTGDPIKRVFVTSDIPHRETWIPYLAASLGDVEAMSLDSVAGFESPGIGLESVKGDNYAAAFGLATRGADVFGYFSYQLGVKSVNLLPNHKTLKSRRHNRVVARASVFATAVSLTILIASIYLFGVQEISQLKDSLRLYEKTEATVVSKKKQVKDLIAERNQQDEIISTSELLETNQILLADSYQKIARVVTEYGWLHSIEFRDNKIVMTGFALTENNVMQVLRGLQEYQHFGEVSLTTLELKEMGYDPSAMQDVMAYQSQIYLHSSVEAGVEGR